MNVLPLGLISKITTIEMYLTHQLRSLTQVLLRIQKWQCQWIELEDRASLWICSTSYKDLKPEDVIINTSMKDKAYVPLPFLDHLLYLQEWFHALLTLSVCALPKLTRFCDLDGYDIIHIQIIIPTLGSKKNEKETYVKDTYILQENSLLVRDLSLPKCGSV